MLYAPRSVRARRFQVALTPSRSLRLGLLFRCAGIPRRIGYYASSNRWFYTDLVRRREGLHTVEREADGSVRNAW